MASRFLDPEQARRLAEHRYEFTSRSLAGRVVLLPGGFGGIGAALTALLLGEGALPVVGYRSRRGHALAMQQKLQDLYGGPITIVEGDVADAAVRERYLQTALDVKGELYGLVALTGDPARVAPGGELDGETLRRSFTANYEANVLLARGSATVMASRGTKGAVVLVSSMQGSHPFEGSLAYAGPKAALIHAALILAKEYGGSNIRVNVVAPGVTTAGMARASIDSGKYDRYVERGVIARFGRPEDVARVVRLLLEPDSYVTGQVITVDGGLTLRRDLST